MADQFAVDLDRGRSWAGQGEGVRFEKDCSGSWESTAQKQTRAATRKGEPIDPREDTHFEQAIPQICFWKEYKLSTVKAAITNQDKFSINGMATASGYDF